MGIINEQKQDSRPRDWAYRVAFDRKDLPSLQDMARHIRETHDTAMIEDFNLKCEQKLKTDQSITLDNGLEIKTVTKTGDLVVNGGLQQCIRLIQGTSSVRWSHFGMSTGSTPSPAVTDTALQLETVAHRVSLAWVEPVGMRLLLGGISSQTDGQVPDSVGEIGVYNGSAAGAILLNRSFFASDSNQPKSDSTPFTVASDPIVLSCVIEFCPVV